MTEEQLALLSALHDGELTGDEEKRVQAWLSNDAEARAALEDLKQAIDALPVTEVPVGRMWDGVERQIAKRRFGWRSGVVAGLAAAAAIFLALQWRPVILDNAPAESSPRVESDGLHAAHAAYVEAIDKLNARAVAVQDKLPDDARQELTASLEAVDRALTVARSARQTAPEDPMVHETLLALYDEKVRVLNAAISAASLGHRESP